MMEEDKKQRHLCKFCLKSFPCGRSLGGHIRSHMSTTSVKTKEKLNKKKLSSSVNGGSNNCNNYMVDFEAGDHVGYGGLRENPKKTWRHSDSINGTLQKGEICKECGKMFHSWKALMGHTRHHSEKDKVSKSLDDDSSLSFANSSVSEIEQEQEEVAMCLMMLSRDVGIWGGLNSVAQSSDKNLVVVDVRSSGLVKQTTEQEGSNGAQIVKSKKPRNRRLESVVSDSKKVRFQRKRSELNVLRNGFKKVELEDSVHGKNKLGKHNLDDEAGFGVRDDKLGKDSCNKSILMCLEAELGNDLIKEIDDQPDFECGKYNLSKRTRFNALDSEAGKDSRKKDKYKCTTCNKVFHSYQALGGHRASYKKVKICLSSKFESNENNIIADVSPDPTSKDKIVKSCSNKNTNVGKKNKHECSICLKVFTSGRALDDHSRCHTVEDTESRGSHTIVIQPKIVEIHGLLDLNLPAPIDEDTNGHIGFNL